LAKDFRAAFSGRSTLRTPQASADLNVGRPAAEPADGESPAIDNRGSVGSQFGDHNRQIIYVYGTPARSNKVAPPPMVGVSGEVDSPYRGLAAFGEQDAAFFFGREEAATKVLELMSKHVHGSGLVVVSGVSGAGKSSLLQAGVLPRFCGAGLANLPDAARWPPLLVVPGATPLDELAVAVAQLAGVDAGSVRRGLDADPAGFALTVRQAARAQPGGQATVEGDVPSRAGGRRLLLIVDQFEQLFTQCTDEQHRRSFIAALHAVASVRPEDIESAGLVVLGVRADFEARCAEYPELADAIQDRFLLTSMTEVELRMAIVEPAKMVGSSVEPELVDLLLRELSTRQPSAAPGVSGGEAVSGAAVLPLVSHVLDQAWRNRIGPTITIADYQRAGGIEGAVAESAQRAYDRLTPTQQAAAPQVFIRLTATTSDGVDTAQRVNRAELTDGKSADEARDIQAAIDGFVAERLLTLDAKTVEISHEVLLQAWPLLHNKWLADTHADRIIRTRFHNAADEWTDHDEDSSYLYSGSLLESATAMVARADAEPSRYPSLSKVERDFLATSERARARRGRRRQGTMVFLVVLALGLAVVAAVAVNARQSAITERNIAVSGKLVVNSEATGNSDPALARLESLAAWRIDPTDQARYAMFEASSLPGIATMTGSGASVNGVAFSPDGKILATGNGDGTVRLWDTATRRQLGQPLGAYSHLQSLNAVAFNPDGKVVAAAGRGGVVRLWDVATHREIGAPLGGGSGYVYSLAFSPDGDLLAAGRDGTVQLWDVATQQQVGAPLMAPGAEILAVAFSPDGTTLATAATVYGSTSASGTVLLWNVSSHRQIGAPLARYSSSVNSLAFSRNGQSLATGWGDDLIDIYDLADTKAVPTLLIGTGAIDSLAFSPAGTTLAAGTSDGDVQIWDIATEEEFGVPLSTDSRPIESVAFSPDGQTLATGSTDGATRLWSAGAMMGDPIGYFDVGDAAARSVAFSPDGKMLATGSLDGVTQLWNAATRDQVGGSLTADASQVYSVAFSPDGKTLATASGDGTARLWDTATYRQLGAALSVAPAGAANAVAFSPDGRTLATGDSDGFVRLWNVATHKQIEVIRTSGPVYTLAFSPDGRVLASGGADGSVQVQMWDVATGRQIGALSDGQTWDVYAVAFSPDGSTIATGGSDQTARLWDVATRQEIGAPLSIDTGTVSSVAFSPNGQILATGSFDGRVRLWDVRTGQQIGGPLSDGGTAAVDSVAFSPDGQTLVAGTYAGVVQLWSVSYLVRLIPDLCAAAGQTLTPTQWTLYAAGPAYQNVCP
jgi:WD40 repeat protein